MHDSDIRNFCCTRKHVVEHGRSERLPPGIEGHFLVKTGADALRRPAANLAVDNHRVDQGSAVLDHDIIQYLDDTGGGVHGYHRSVGGVCKGSAVALGTVASHLDDATAVEHRG